uniref:Tail fiber protein n=1 Tax=Staphylococcus phage Pel53 TaxID=3234048 RepID=A0AB39C6M4_9CAUD
MAKGYSLDALVQEHYGKFANLGTTNINNLFGIDAVGAYPQPISANASVANGYPSGAIAGTLEVIPHSANVAGHVMQRYTNYTSSPGSASIRSWLRSQAGSNDSFSNWIEQVDMNNIYNAIYPIGIVLKFDNATNPNNAFTGTVWEQIVDGRTARAATGPEAGTADGQIGSVAGSDTANIAVTNLPGHTHGMQNHTHGIASHTHTMTHTHSINHQHPKHQSTTNGAHIHAVTGKTTTNGNHTHGAAMGNNANVTPTIFAGSDSGQVTTRNVLWAGDHSHDLNGTAGTAGDHFHEVALPNFVGTSGGSSAANTGGTALTSGSPSNNNTTSTGDGTALNVRNSSHYYAFWKRVA